jgi:hypothetical protein
MPFILPFTSGINKLVGGKSLFWGAVFLRQKRIPYLSLKAFRKLFMIQFQRINMLQYKTFTIPALGPEEPESELNDFLRSRRVVSVQKSLDSVRLNLWGRPE